MLIDMLLGQFERAHNQGAFLEQQDVVQNPAVTPVPSGYSLLKKVERIHDILASKSITPDDKKIQFQALLSGGLDLPSLRTPDTQDVQYGLFPWVAKRPIANDSLLH